MWLQLAALKMTIEKVEVFTTKISPRFVVTGVIMVQNMLYTKLTGCFLSIYVNIIYKLENLLYLKVIFFTIQGHTSHIFEESRNEYGPCL